MFFLSVLLVVVSSYLISKRVAVGFFPTYIFLIAFAQIVLSFEILSLFSAISEQGFLICNVVFFITAVILFRKTNFSICGQTVKNINKIFTALKCDKALIFLGICFIFFFIFQLIRIFAFPVTFGDALSCYLQRCTDWIQNGNISHYVTPDARELIMPVNMEFLYTWVLLFKKSEAGLGFFSFIGYIGVIYVLYNLLKELKFGIKRRIWAIFAFSSFALVMEEIVTPCHDVFTGALILASIYLFLKGIKYEDKIAIYFSSLAYALAVGTKTTAIMAIPSVFIIFCVISYLYKKNYRFLLYFCFFFIINFLIFSSYNYILNFIQFNNFLSNRENFLIHQFTDGIQGYIANVIKYFFVIFDMSGSPEFININAFIENLLKNTLSLFGLDIQTGASDHFTWGFEYNNKTDMLNSALGFMGLAVFLPSVIYSIKRGIKNKSSKEAVFMCILGLSIIFNILLFSRAMVFAGYNMRYLITFVIIASPILAYSYPYKHKFCKIFLCLIMFIYLVGNTHHKPISYIIECIKERKFVQVPLNDEEVDIFKYFLDKTPSNIGLIIPMTKKPIFHIEKLRLYGFKTDKLLIENIENTDLAQFNYIILLKEEGLSTNIVNFKDRIKNPQNYVSRCEYKDKHQNIIKNYEESKTPVMVKCEVPLDYVKMQGFEEEPLKSENYIILKRK